MSYNVAQFRDLVRRTLGIYPELQSEAAVNLLLGTCAVESDFGTMLRQINGPALGPFQIEESTYNWLEDKYKARYLTAFMDGFTALEWDLRKSILVARLRYRVLPQSLPDENDILALATYWKEYYNTDLGAGTVEMFVRNYQHYITGD